MTHDLAIIYEDATLIAVNKPSGELSVPGRVQPNSTASRVKDYFSYAREIHRLDMGTSGVMLFAKHKSAQAHIQRQFERRETHKKYYAVCAGKPAAVEGVIELPLLCDWPNRPRQKVNFIEGKAARTHYRIRSLRNSELQVLINLCFGSKSEGNKYIRAFSAVELFPLTGRSHQLRVHLAEIGHPILGDELYAPLEWQQASPRLLLHASELTITHPDSQSVLTLSATSELDAFFPNPMKEDLSHPANGSLR